MFKQIISDIDSVFDRDPAARHRLEVIFCYPGVHAVLIYRLSHWLWGIGAKFIARLISTIARILTGIEIHPAANIGQRLFIDHGIGVVIGETSKIGDDVTIYHDVTLGGVSMEKNAIRHPQVGNHVIIGSGAQLLGPVVVGDYARIGSNAVVVEDVGEGETVVGVPARRVREKLAQEPEKGHSFKAYGTPEDKKLDPTISAIEQLKKQVEELSAQVNALQAAKTTDKDEGTHATKS